MCQQRNILPYSDDQYNIVLVSICMWLQLLICIQKRSFTHTFVHVCSCIKFVAAVPAVITNLIFLCHVGPIQNKVSLLYDPVKVIWNFYVLLASSQHVQKILLSKINFNDVSSLIKTKKIFPFLWRIQTSLTEQTWNGFENW